MIPSGKKQHVPPSDPGLQTRLGDVVRTFRRQLGITQQELAWRANMHRTYIADVERGARNVTLRSVVNLARALQVSLGNLFDYAAAPAATPMRVGAGDAPAGVREILLVEDDAADAAMTARAFRRAGIANPLQTVSNGEAGLNYLFATGRFAQRQPGRPQLILLDLNLPQMSGLDFLRRVKGDERTRDIPVVVLTGSRSDRMILESARLGAEHYIVKPLGIENFVRLTPKLNLHITLGPLVKNRSESGSA